MYLEPRPDGLFALRENPADPAPGANLSMLTFCVYWARRVLDDMTVGRQPFRLARRDCLPHPDHAAVAHPLGPHDDSTRTPPNGVVHGHREHSPRFRDTEIAHPGPASFRESARGQSIALAAYWCRSRSRTVTALRHGVVVVCLMVEGREQCVLLRCSYLHQKGIIGGDGSKCPLQVRGRGGVDSRVALDVVALRDRR
jgi:hypothetical protein